jgi:hypothetical protein
MRWNTGDHARKFMETEATHMTGAEAGTERRGRVVFWGEWEGPSLVVRKWPKNGEQPRFLHQPFWEHPTIAGSRQNTDPWVFGDYFRYSNCKQLTDRRKPTAMQGLTPGSLVLFGSARGGGFVLDTVFVIGQRVGTFVPAQGNTLGEDEAFFCSTLDSLNTSEEEKVRRATFTLFRGATPSARTEGMFSFTPCLPADGDIPRFVRPAIELPGVLNRASWQTPAGAKRPRPQDEVTQIWHRVVAQVIEQDLALATRLELPFRGDLAGHSGVNAVGPEGPSSHGA